MSETQPASATEGAERFNVSMSAELASRVDEAARAAGTNRSAQVRELACRGLASLLREGAADPEAAQVTVALPQGGSRRLTPQMVASDVLPACAQTLCEDARWLQAVPQEVRSDMTTRVAAAAAGLGADELPLQIVVSVACVLAADPASPWMLSQATRPAATAQAARALVAEPSAATAARRLLCPVCDVLGPSPTGPVQMLAAILNAADASDTLLAGARQSLQRLLGATEGEMYALADAARTVATDPDASAEQTPEAEDALVRWARSLGEQDSPTSRRSPSAPERRAAFRPRGAQEIVALATERPRATLPELESAAHVSHSTLQRRLAELEAAGIMRNAGTSRQPLWEVAGTHHEPEELLTEVQRRVLRLVREDPLRQRTEVAAELEVSPSLVSKAYHELAYLGLVKKSGRGWVAVERKDGMR